MQIVLRHNFDNQIARADIFGLRFFCQTKLTSVFLFEATHMGAKRCTYESVSHLKPLVIYLTRS